MHESNFTNRVMATLHYIALVIGVTPQSCSIYWRMVLISKHLTRSELDQYTYTSVCVLLGQAMVSLTIALYMLFVRLRTRQPQYLLDYSTVSNLQHVFPTINNSKGAILPFFHSSLIALNHEIHNHFIPIQDNRTPFDILKQPEKSHYDAFEDIMISDLLSARKVCLEWIREMVKTAASKNFLHLYLLYTIGISPR